MKVLSVFKYVFSIVGVALLISALFVYKNTSDFLLNAVSAQGTIIDLVQSRSSESVSYHPVVKFIDADGQEVEFTSSTGGSASSYPLGKIVEVLYLPHDVKDARVKSFFALWGAALLMAILGAGFAFIGAIIFLFGMLRGRKKAYLQRSGVAVEAQIQAVELNQSLSMNGQNPFVILCQWLNPVSRQLHVFKSENIWFDPSPYIEQDAIKVLIEKDNPKKYYVDISFLPKLAD
ncbi:DUF3592 domain-containing protein [Pseudomonas sp. WS 5412]|uniref:DUF3592 domain-containing protein n=1 Tax=Pseudomonas sp. WS 5412 TaxID=2717487 RepID=UPI00147622CE|nr:DUF3592 domain-containing protein [Pseudomonas sp. WS 5412]NMY30709.1 DUF3592 domain-containing protein [Pseudomonas sp. WS 5412]